MILFGLAGDVTTGAAWVMLLRLWLATTPWILAAAGALFAPPGESCTVREEKGVRVLWSPAHKYQVPPKAYRASVFEEFYNQGLNDLQIAKKAGCSHSTVANWRKRTGRPPNYKRQKAATDPEKIKKDFESGVPEKDPCSGCRSKNICKSYGGTCNAKALWDGR